MKVTKITSIPVRAGAFGGFYVRVDTDAGVYGLGEALMVLAGRAVAEAVAHLSELIVGEDPFSTERHWQHMFRRGFFPASGVYSCAISAIDIALWDIKGKALGLPVHALLGGPVRDKVVCYPHCQAPSTEALVANCVDHVERGWKFVRWGLPDNSGLHGASEGVLDPVKAVDIGVEQMARVREAVGPDVHLCFDVHTRLDTAHAAAFCRRVEQYNPFFIEDPLRAENPASYRTLARTVNVPIAAGEQWSNKWQFREAIEDETISYARIDLCGVGGITEAAKITHWAETHYIDIAPHNPLGPVSAAAGVALCTASTNVGVLEMPRAPGTYEADLFPVQVGFEDGYAFSEGRPGLGVEIDMDVAEARAWTPSGFYPRVTRSDGATTNW